MYTYKTNNARAISIGSKHNYKQGMAYLKPIKQNIVRKNFPPQKPLGTSSGILPWMLSGIFQWMLTCSAAVSEGLSVPRCAIKREL